MPDRRHPDPVRMAIRWLGMSALLALASCQSASLGGSGASGSAASFVAELRSENGLAPLTTDARLERAALQQARYMAAAGAMKHTTGRGKDFASRMSENDVAAPAAENIAEGRMDAGRLMSIWMASPPHRKNLLDARMTRFGLASASAKDGERRYWAMVLGK